MTSAFKAIVIATACAAGLAAGTAEARPVGGGFHGAAFHGGGYHGGYYHGGYGYRGYRGGYWGPGAFIGGIGLGLGIGALAYPAYGYGTYGYYDDAPVVVSAPTYVMPDAAPQSAPAPARPAADPIFYPRTGQSAAKTESDRRECNQWATTQAGAMNDAGVFQRATMACMEGRNYTVR